ncbi:hypothetical protein SO802_000288 [Lithocarpus litseifolius]
MGPLSLWPTETHLTCLPHSPTQTQRSGICLSNQIKQLFQVLTGRDKWPSKVQVPMATLRNLKIKTGTCKRIVKELHSYEKEVEREAAKTADMKEKGADPYDLKQQENVLAESRMMIPDCRKRLEASLADLKGTLAELEESNQKEGTEIEEAKSTIVEVEQLFQTTEA